MLFPLTHYPIDGQLERSHLLKAALHLDRPLFKSMAPIRPLMHPRVIRWGTRGIQWLQMLVHGRQKEDQ